MPLREIKVGEIIPNTRGQRFKILAVDVPAAGSISTANVPHPPVLAVSVDTEEIQYFKLDGQPFYGINAALDLGIADAPIPFNNMNTSLQLIVNNKYVTRDYKQVTCVTKIVGIHGHVKYYFMHEAGMLFSSDPVESSDQDMLTPYETWSNGVVVGSDGQSDPNDIRDDFSGTSPVRGGWVYVPKTSSNSNIPNERAWEDISKWSEFNLEKPKINLTSDDSNLVYVSLAHPNTDYQVFELFRSKDVI